MIYNFLLNNCFKSLALIFLSKASLYQFAQQVDSSDGPTPAADLRRWAASLLRNKIKNLE